MITAFWFTFGILAVAGIYFAVEWLWDFIISWPFEQ